MEEDNTFNGLGLPEDKPIIEGKPKGETLKENEESIKQKEEINKGLEALKQKKELIEMQKEAGRIQAEISQYIHKKVAALEVWHSENRIRTVSFVGIVSTLVIAVAGAFGRYTAAGCAGLLSIGFAYLAWQAILKMKYLEEHYKLKLPKIKNE